MPQRKLKVKLSTKAKIGEREVETVMDVEIDDPKDVDFVLRSSALTFHELTQEKEELT